ncbi:hypothetical protein RND71_008275 [Anisodus tanguticus]|uniref:Uncharacterized protein n=1 Tax=Anisodus tanguticus TaxID=243964 RepID=A0AAE1SQJ1_9SOLA|nr:hypothetical protein RND71_008275 [Anisodus tanguticus]
MNGNNEYSLQDDFDGSSDWSCIFLDILFPSLAWANVIVTRLKFFMHIVIVKCLIDTLLLSANYSTKKRRYVSKND